MSTTVKLRTETVPERVLRQVRTGKLDEERLLPAADKQTCDVAHRANENGATMPSFVTGRS